MAVFPPADYEQNVWMYEDTLTGSVDLVAPSDGTTSARTDSATLSWDALDGAKQYQIKVNTSPDFKGSAIADVNTKLTSDESFRP